MDAISIHSFFIKKMKLIFLDFKIKHIFAPAKRPRGATE